MRKRRWSKARRAKFADTITKKRRSRETAFEQAQRAQVEAFERPKPTLPQPVVSATLDAALDIPGFVAVRRPEKVVIEVNGKNRVYKLRRMWVYVPEEQKEEQEDK